MSDPEGEMNAIDTSVRDDPGVRSTAGGGPTYHSGWILVPQLIRYLLSNRRRHGPRGTIPGVRLRAIAALLMRGRARSRRGCRLGRYYYGASLRTPRWPSPAFDRMIANGGMNLAPGFTEQKHQIDTAILAVTRRCFYKCVHCYDSLNRADEDVVPVDRWIEAVRHLERIGTSVIVLSGGEPMLRYEDLLSILDQSDPDLSDVHLHSSGAGVTPARARELAARGLVAAGIGLDFPDPERHDRFRGVAGAFDAAVRALEAFAGAGVFTYTNLCLTRELVASGGLYEYLKLAKDLRVGVVQLLEPKPCGMYASRNGDELFSQRERDETAAFFEEANTSRRYARFPPVAYTARFERADRFGCLMGGLGHLAIDGNGNVNPCVFVPVSFGNINDEEFPSIYERMRSACAAPHYGECPALLLNRRIRAERERMGGATVRYEGLRAQWAELLGAKR